MDRRRFLSLAAATAFSPALPGSLVLADEARRSPVLILVEFNGGNDGLNTIIPLDQPLYAEMRPKLAVEAETVLPLSGGVGANPALGPLMELWQAGEMAVLQGLGYPNPNRSHFIGIQNWDTALSGERLSLDGWAGRAIATMARGERRADAILLGRSHAGPIANPDIRALFLNNPAGLKQLTEDAAAEGAMRMEAPTPLVQKVAALRQTVQVAGQDILSRLETVSPDLLADFPERPIGRQMRDAFRLLAAGIEVPVIKLSHGSFDTHAGQRVVHDRLLKEFAEAVAAFRTAARRLGRWDDVLILTYSEFGRRPVQNASLGTDHGTAAPHFAFGGRVKGGVHGTHPDLSVLSSGDLVPTADFRQVYATVLDRWWGIRPDSLLAGTFELVDFLRV